MFGFKGVGGRIEGFFKLQNEEEYGLVQKKFSNPQKIYVHIFDNKNHMQLFSIIRF